MRKELRFILLSIVFSIWETLRNILRSSFSLSKLAKSVEADPWKQDSCLNCRKYTSYLVWKHCSHLHCEAFLCMVTDWLSAHFRLWEITRLVTSSLRVGASVDNCIKLPGPDWLMPPLPLAASPLPAVQDIYMRKSRQSGTSCLNKDTWGVRPDINNINSSSNNNNNSWACWHWMLAHSWISSLIWSIHISFDIKTRDYNSTFDTNSESNLIPGIGPTTKPWILPSVWRTNFKCFYKMQINCPPDFSKWEA